MMLPSAELACEVQLSQLPDPVAFLYLPWSHAAHAPPSGPEYPALQAHFVIAMLALGECAFVGQSLQLPSPAASFHFPATHAVHAPPSGPE